MTSRILGLVLFVLIVTVLLGTQLSFATLLDLRSLALVLTLIVGGLWWTFGPKLAFQAFLPPGVGSRPKTPFQIRRHLKARRRARSLAFGAGIVGLLIGFISMLSSMSDPTQMGSSLALAMMAPLYGSLLAWFVFSGSPRSLKAPTN